MPKEPPCRPELFLAYDKRGANIMKSTIYKNHFIILGAGTLNICKDTQVTAFAGMNLLLLKKIALNTMGFSRCLAR